MTFNDPDDDDRDSTPPPSGPMPGQLSLEERVRRSELLERATRQREKHALDKSAWTKVWKRKDEYFAELIARLTREAGTGVDEGGQLSIPGTDDLPSPSAAVEVLSGRWAELAQVTPPRISAWTLKEADLSPVATKLLGLLRPGKKGEERPRRVTLERGDLPKLLDCLPSVALDALAELLCFGLAQTAGKSGIATAETRDEALRLGDWRSNDGDPGLAVLRAMVESEIDVVPPDCLVLEVKLPRRALLPLLEGLKGLGAVEAVDVDGELHWRRVARVPLWERLLLETLARVEGIEHLAERALEGCIDVSWTLRGLLEAGVLRPGRQSTSGGRWELVPEADRKPLDLDQVKTMVKRKFAVRASPYSSAELPIERLVNDLELQPATLRCACRALVAEGWLALAKEPKHGGHYFGPWYQRAEDKKEKAGKKAPKDGRPRKDKSSKKPAAKPNLRQQARQRQKAATKEAKAPEGSAQERTKPLFDDVAPAPMVDGEEETFEVEEETGE